jgi:hypothetical protein
MISTCKHLTSGIKVDSGISFDTVVPVSGNPTSPFSSPVIPLISFIFLIILSEL